MRSISVCGPIEVAGVSLAGGISFLVDEDDRPFPLPFPLERAVGAEALAEIGCRLTGGRLAARLRAGVSCFAGAFFAALLRVAGFFAGAFFAAAVLAAGFFAAGFLAAGFFAGVRFAGAFFAAGFLAAAGFFAAVRFAELFAVDFAGAFFAGAFFAGAFFAAGFLAVLDFRAAGFEEDDPVPPVDLRDEVERLVRLRSSAITLAGERRTRVGTREPVSLT